MVVHWLFEKLEFHLLQSESSRPAVSLNDHVRSGVSADREANVRLPNKVTRTLQLQAFVVSKLLFF